MPKTKVSTRQVASETSLLGLQVAGFSLCSHRAQSLNSEVLWGRPSTFEIWRRHNSAYNTNYYLPLLRVQVNFLFLKFKMGRRRVGGEGEKGRERERGVYPGRSLYTILFLYFPKNSGHPMLTLPRQPLERLFRHLKCTPQNSEAPVWQRSPEKSSWYGIGGLDPLSSLLTDQHPVRPPAWRIPGVWAPSFLFHNSPKLKWVSTSSEDP